MHNNEWGTVCKENFDDIDARVACRQLGFRNGNVLENTKTGGNLKVWLSNVRCYGGENKLTDCSHSDWGSHHCSHDKVVGIRCGEGQGDVRINSGRLEIYYNGTWGTVCNASIGDEEATVACRQLGYNSGKSLGIGVDDGTGIIWVHTVYCNGNERRLVDCSINFNKFDGSRSYCRHTRDVGIECFSAYEGHVRIKSSGGLEIFHDNEWGAVCKEGFDDTDASVACRQLGYRGNKVSKRIVQSVNFNDFLSQFEALPNADVGPNSPRRKQT
ncbi:neurotrypsin-like [Mytilus trossulus]|uniref:neurotrypsin-like n=1 Tax=Mytilus trossulus TaxID=6551 RepID=UPI0030079191